MKSFADLDARQAAMKRRLALSLVTLLERGRVCGGCDKHLPANEFLNPRPRLRGALAFAKCRKCRGKQ